MSDKSRGSSTVGSAELARQRDVSRYYQAWLNAKKMRAVPANVGGISESGQARCSYDANLTALAQLAALRLNVKRGMISLIDNKAQIVLAEATRTLSLVDGSRHAPGDHIWLGNVSLPRSDCMDEHAFGAITTCEDAAGAHVDMSALVVNDTLLDERFESRTYATIEGVVRFYAGVPIITKQGHSIGVYAVSDSQPRPQGLGLDEIQFMQDVARIVAEHLEKVADSTSRVSERNFVEGISHFLEDLSELKDNIIDSRSPPQRTEHRQSTNDLQATDPQTSSPKGSSSSSSPAGSTAQDPPATSPESDIAQEQKEHYHDTLPRFSRDNKVGGGNLSDPFEDNTRRVFKHASQLMCKQFNAAGCIFVDAAKGDSSERPQRGALSPRKAGPSASINPDSEPMNGRFDVKTMPYGERDAVKHISVEYDNGLAQMAQVLSLTLADDIGNIFPGGIVRRKSLEMCFSWYPSAICFYLDRGHVTGGRGLQPAEKRADGHGDGMMPAISSSQYKMLPTEILERLPGAKWLIFLPLFDYAHRQWFAGGFVWGNDFSMGDPHDFLPFFKTFGSCIMREVASMEVLNTNIAKSTFIASISHDLRSPLHGMLGSLEFLEDTMTSAYQMSLVGAMETCGKTLLDTIDHLLDYAKINNLNRASTSLATPSERRAAEGPDAIVLTSQEGLESSPFNFLLLLEEVVEAVFAGQTFRKMDLRHHTLVDEAIEDVKAMSLDDSAPAEEQIHAGSAKFSGRVSFVLNVEKSSFWSVVGQTGALRRVIMNLVGNAIKYCTVGYIEVSAKVTQRSPSDVDIELAIRDTGVGMSEDFINNHLFKPFAQENPFTPGTGLGLSITSQILDNLGGSIKIHSEKGIGTHVQVSIPMKAAPRDSYIDTLEQTVLEVSKMTAGKKISILNPDAHPNGHDTAAGKLESSMISLCGGWFDMVCTRSSNVGDDPDTSLYVYAEPPPIEALIEQHRQRVEAGHPSQDAALLIICTNAFEAAALRAAGVNQLVSLGRIIEVVSQPVGLRKIARVLQQCVQRLEEKRLCFADTHESSESQSDLSSFSSRDVERRAAEVEVQALTVRRGPPGPPPGILRWKSDEPRRSSTSTVAGSAESASIPGHAKNETAHGSSQAQAPFESSAEQTRLPPHVLLVDDNAINLKLLVTFMKKIQLPYAEATNGLEAVDRYKHAERRFDYVLMDLQMPVMDGFEATRKIREFERERGVTTASTIIAITGVGNEKAKTEAAEAGMSRYLTKPVKFKELQQLLTSHG